VSERQSGEEHRVPVEDAATAVVGLHAGLLGR
jgi:hypothetical protein